MYRENFIFFFLLIIKKRAKKVKYKVKIINAVYSPVLFMQQNNVIKLSFTF